MAAWCLSLFLALLIPNRQTIIRLPVCPPSLKQTRRRRHSSSSSSSFTTPPSSNHAIRLPSPHPGATSLPSPPHDSPPGLPLPLPRPTPPLLYSVLPAPGLAQAHAAAHPSPTLFYPTLQPLLTLMVPRTRPSTHPSRARVRRRGAWPSGAAVRWPWRRTQRGTGRDGWWHWGRRS